MTKCFMLIAARGFGRRGDHDDVVTDMPLGGVFSTPPDLQRVHDDPLREQGDRDHTG